MGVRFLPFLLCLIVHLVYFIAPVGVQAQNPFELHHRLQKSSSLPPQQPADSFDTRETQAVVEDTSAINDEEVVGPSSPSSEDSPPVAEKDEVEVNMPEVLQSKRNLIFGTFIILALYLTVVISFRRSIVTEVFRSIMNDNFLNLLMREHRTRGFTQLVFLYFFFVINLALLIFLMVDRFDWPNVEANLLQLTGWVVGLYIIRHLVLYQIGKVFPVERSTGQFGFTIMLFNIFLGVLIFPLNLFVAFAPPELAKICMYIALITVGLFYIFRQLRGLFIGAHHLLRHQFHFILYLCSVEIAPMIVLFKFFQPYY